MGRRAGSSLWELRAQCPWVSVGDYSCSFSRRCLDFLLLYFANPRDTPNGSLNGERTVFTHNSWTDYLSGRIPLPCSSQSKVYVAVSGDASFLVGADGSGARAHIEDTAGVTSGPWSRDNSRIAILSVLLPWRDETVVLSTVAPDGTHRRHLARFREEQPMAESPAPKRPWYRLR